MELLSSFFASENGIAVIATALGAFFLIAALIKGARNRHHRQMRETAEYAVAHGGTPDSPVHIGNPFDTAQPAAPEAPAATPSPAGGPGAESPAFPQPAAPAPAQHFAGGPGAEVPSYPNPAPPPPQQPAAPNPDDAYTWE